MGTYYNYNCQVCGTMMYHQSKVRRCEFCGIQLCRPHKIKGFCPAHDALLLPEEKSKFRALSFWGSTMCGCPCFMFILIMMFAVLTPYLSITVGVGLGITILIVYPISIHFGTKSATKKATYEVLLRVTRDQVAQKQRLQQSSFGSPSLGQAGNLPSMPPTSNPSPSPFELNFGSGSPQTRSNRGALGNNLSSSTITCPSCGSKFTRGKDLFCGNCGSKLE